MTERIHDITVTVNGEDVRETVDARTTLVDFLREDLALTGSHVGCEHGVCGACTVRVDGVIVRGCLMLAVQCDDAAHGARAAQSRRRAEPRGDPHAPLRQLLPLYRLPGHRGRGRIRGAGAGGTYLMSAMPVPPGATWV